MRVWPCLVVLVGCAFLKADAMASPDLSGLWEAQRRFGPEVRGTLLLRATPDGELEAEIDRFRVAVRREGDGLSFALPGDRGWFRGRFDRETGDVVGHWYAPRAMITGLSEASAVTLRRTGDERWGGRVAPLDDGFTFLLRLDRIGENRYSAFWRNPERNLGVFFDLDSAEFVDERVLLTGTWRGRGESRVLFEGTVEAGGGLISVPIPSRGGTYDFRKVADERSSAFYPRGWDAERYAYREPPQTGDGWATASLGDVGIDRGAIEVFVRSELFVAPDGVHSPYIDGVLIARHGKLVLEEYFYGFYRDRPHDTRSASKSAASVLIGAAIHAGAPVSVDSRVYETMFDGDVPGGVDPRARRMTLGHLLTMSSGFFCDDGNPDAPGNEDTMQEQAEEPDWYRYTLGVPMAAEPGREAVYCSSNPNLAVGMLGRITGVPIEEMFYELIAEPLQMGRYHLLRQPSGEPYWGGGSYWLPRDFMKLGQLMLDGGVWNGRRVLSEEWVRDATSPLVRIGGHAYGYQWWVREYRAGDRTLNGFFAAGNGGNVVVVIPEAGLVVAFYGSNYSDPSFVRPQQSFIERYILPAVGF